MKKDNGTVKLSVIDTTVNRGLCIGCGLCAAICPEDALEMRWDKSRTYIPVVDNSRCNDCGQCVRVCPNTPERVSEYALAAAREGERFGLPDKASYFIAYDLDPDNRLRSASGGALTSLLMYLLKSGEVNGVIASVPVTAPVGEPHYEIKVMRSPQELDEARSSHYHPLCYQGELQKLKSGGGRYALVGVPCVLRGVARLPAKLRKNIRYTIGLACSKNVTGQFLDCLAQQMGIKEGEPFTANQRDKTGITDANNYNICFQLPDRKIRRNRFQITWTRMWRNYFFTPECCLYCPDFFGAEADLSVKDAWGKWSTDPLGKSMLVVRRPELVTVLEKLRDNNTLSLEPSDADDILQSQVETPRFKHVDVRDRLVWKGAIRRELKKTGHPPGTSRRWWSRNSRHYWQLLFMIRSSKYLYRRYGKLPVSTVAKIDALAHPFSIALPYFYRRTGLSRLVAAIRFSAQLAGHMVGRPLPEPSPQRNGLNVLISGGYGYGNTGDEAQLGANINRWRQLQPEAKITVLSPNPQYTESAHGVNTEPAPRVVFFNADRITDYGESNSWFKWKFRLNKPRLLLNARLAAKGLPSLFLLPREARLLQRLRSADVLHLSGGGYLTGMTLSRLWDNMLLIRLADLLGTPVILSGQTIGIFKDRESGRLAHWGLEKAKLIYLRDSEESRADLAAIGINGGHVSSSFDDALFCDVADNHAVNDCLRKSGIDADLPYTAVSVWTDQLEVFRRLAEITDFITAKHGIQVLFTPTAPPDEAVAREVQGYKVEKSGVMIYDYDYRLIKGVIGQAKFCLTMKHHPIIFAMSLGVPTISVAGDEYFFRKNLGALKLFGQGKWMIDRDTLFIEGKAEEMLKNFLQNNTGLSKEIRSHLESYRQRDGEVIRRFLEEIKGGNKN